METTHVVDGWSPGIRSTLGRAGSRLPSKGHLSAANVSDPCVLLELHEHLQPQFFVIDV
jgi:hypothetical protein